MGALGGSLLTFAGIALFKHWRQNAFGSLSSSSPTTKMISGDPNVLVNNATESVHNIITVDPALGILYSPSTGIYDIELQTNLVLADSVTEEQTMQVLIVRNGLPTDSAAVLFRADVSLSPGAPMIVPLHGLRILRREDYIQVFHILLDSAGTPIPLTRLTFDFKMSLVKPQGDAG
jgi:hypothetical protein